MAASLAFGTPFEKDVMTFVDRAKAQDRSFRAELALKKEGVFTGSSAINPLTNTKVPIFIGNFVLMEYGTGAIMAVPAHDQRDFEFAKEFDLPIVVTINPKDRALDPVAMEGAYEEDGVMTTRVLSMEGTIGRPSLPSSITSKRKAWEGGQSTSGSRIGAYRDSGTGAHLFP